MKLNELLGIEFPIIQGAMAGIATGEFAAACSNAGGLGVIATGALKGGPDALRREIARCRELTDRPFGVNLVIQGTDAASFAKVVAEEKVPVVTTGNGNPRPFIPMLKEAGIKVIPVVGASAHAAKLAAYGVDAVIGEGTEAGGHIGEMTTMALIPQLVDASPVPVVAAGGIADGRQVAAAFAMGASGIQVGTCLLTSEECPIHPNYKQALIDAQDIDTTVTGRRLKSPVRLIKNAMASEYLELEMAGASAEELEKLTVGSLRLAVHEGNVERGSVMAGQVAGMLKAVRPLREIFEELMRDSKAVLAATEQFWRD